MTEATQSNSGDKTTELSVGSGSNGTTVLVASTSRVSKKTGSKKKRKDKCFADKCGSSAVKFVGDCQFCQGHFCSRHRLMENHSCQGLKSCKEQMHQRNAEKLAAEQTIVSKIQI
ncbi:LAQU0S04e00210g1_1 [Lachancea quebecensis]|uniref:LAQU0S04e00210g1_1 n=1 Tax=Lachancea quebecensis TaxID=1654605 RepID=A0A0P1KPG6_9SACH|nr:LAQU0S04e00210g1_1 [Lachancea quebecensis]